MALAAILREGILCVAGVCVFVVAEGVSFEGFGARKDEILRGPRGLGSKVRDSSCRADHSLTACDCLAKLSLLLGASTSSH